MERDFQKLMAAKPDEGLQDYLNNRSKYTPEAIEAALAEMQKRGHAFSDEELVSLRMEINERKEIARKEEVGFWLYVSPWEKNVVSDEDAPAYYSEGMIFLFSVFFSFIFGFVFMAINIQNTGSKKGITEVIIFGILFWVLEIWVLLTLTKFILLALILNAIGAIILNQFFWRKYIGKNIRYRYRSVRTPLIVGAFIKALVLVSVFTRTTDIIVP